MMDGSSSSHRNGCNLTLDPYQQDQILLANGVTAICSSLSCVVGITLLIGLRLQKHFVYRLALYQVLGSLFQGVSMALVLMLLHYDRHPDSLYYKVTCKVTAFLIEYSLWVKLLFTIWLTFHLFFYVVFFKNLKKLEWLYILSSVLLPLLFAWVPFLHDSYGVSGAWCYIRSWDDNCASNKYKTGIIEQFLLYYGPATLALIFNIIVIIAMLAIMVSRVKKSVRVNSTTRLVHSLRDSKLEVLKQLLPLLAYPIIYFTLIIFPLTNRIYMAAANSIDPSLIMAQAVAQSSMGFFAGLALILHITTIQIKNRRQPRMGNTSGRHGNVGRTFSEVTPYTSGAETYFSLHNETEVDDRIVSEKF